MLQNDPEYRRLRVGGHGGMSSASYWLGQRQLLVVVVSGYIEKYQRYQYRDIQALFMRKTRVPYIWGFGFAALALACGLGAFETLNGRALMALDTESRVACLIMSILGLAFIGLVIINALLGPTCACYLRTALQTVPLPQLRRWKKAERLIADLSPLVLAAQASSQSPQTRHDPGLPPSPLESSNQAPERLT